MTDLAPIVVFAYNRPEHLRRAVEGLRANGPAAESELYVFCDGPRDESDEEGVAQVRSFAHSIEEFDSVTVTERERNLGCAESVIRGVSEVIESEGRVIVLEDDLVPGRHFLTYMNRCLEAFADDPRVFSIGAWTPDIPFPEGYEHDIYLSYRDCSLGWGTWKERWQQAVWEVDEAFIEELVGDRRKRRRFLRGGRDLLPMLRHQVEGKIDSWAVRWTLAHALKDACCVRPVRPLVTNTGNDGTGTHDTPGSRARNPNFDPSFAPEVDPDVSINRTIVAEFATYYDGIPRRYPERLSYLWGNLVDWLRSWKSRILRSVPLVRRPFWKVDKARRFRKKAREELAEYVHATEITPRLEAPLVHPPRGSGDLRRILHVSSSDVGGAAQVARDLCEHQLGEGCDAGMLVGKRRTDLDYVEEVEQKYPALQTLLNEYQRWHGLLDLYSLAGLHLGEHELVERADIVHFHNIHSGGLSIFSLMDVARQKPVVWTLHDMQSLTGHCAYSLDCGRWKAGCGNCPYPEHYPPVKVDRTAQMWELKRKIYDRCDATVVCPSEWLKNKVEQSILSGSPTCCIPNGVDTEVFVPREKTQCRRELGLPLDRSIVLFIAHGGLEDERKGGSYVRAVSDTLANEGDGVLFVTIGDQREEREGNRLLLPYVEGRSRLAAYYAAADLLLLPSRAEVAPLTVLESLACGTPVVAFGAGGIPDQVQHLGTGYMASPGDTEDLLAGVHHFLDDPELLAGASERAARKVRQEFSREAVGERYLSLYEDVLAAQK